MAQNKKSAAAAGRSFLTVEAIVDAALQLVDEEGLDRLSMRRLGGRLGVEAMTLYHHVPSKDALLDRLVTRVLTQADFLEPAGDLDWRDRLERFATRYRAILRSRPNLAPLIATRPVRSPEALRHLAAGGATLLRAGFTVEECFFVGNAVAILVIGAVLAELGPTPRGARKVEDAGAFAAVMNDAASAVHDHDAIFHFALGAFLDGVALKRADASPKADKETN